jgi:hypothetical protein
MSKPMKNDVRPNAKKLVVVGVRMDDEFLKNLDQWISDNQAGISRPEAIRRFLDVGLNVQKKAQWEPALRAVRAKELAAGVIGSMGDPSAHPEERAERRRRLARGPEEFRHVRVDRPKASAK